MSESCWRQYDRRQPARQRRRSEDHEPGRMHPPRAEPISRRADDQDQRGVFCLPAFRMTAGLPAVPS